MCKLDCMHEPDALDFWRKDFVAALRLIGWAAARLPYGMPEPVLGGQAAVELYSGGLWPPTRQVELLTTDASRLRAELMEMGFRADECSPSDARNLWHPTIDRCITIARAATTRCQCGCRGDREFRQAQPDDNSGCRHRGFDRRPDIRLAAERRPEERDYDACPGSCRTRPRWRRWCFSASLFAASACTADRGRGRPRARHSHPTA